MPFETIEYQVDGPVLILTLNRPEKLNAYNEAMVSELVTAWQNFASDENLVCAVLTGRGRAFCTGADLRSVSGGSEGYQSHQPLSPHVMSKQNGVFKPIICAVNGVCAAGGFYFVGYSDIVICGESASFFDPHVSRGLASTTEPTLLSRRIPLAWVLRMFLMGLQERMDSATAERIGLVTEVVRDEDLLPRAVELAHKVAKNAPLAVHAAVEAIWSSLDMGLTSAIQHSITTARLYNAVTGERAEGIEAFLEKRDPDWTRSGQTNVGRFLGAKR